MKLYRFMAVATVSFAGVAPLWAQPAAGAPALEQFSSVGLNLVLVLALIAVAAWFARRSPLVNAARSKGPMKILATLPIGPKERIVLIEAGTQRLLVGVSPAGMFQLGSSASPLQADGDHSFEQLL